MTMQLIRFHASFCLRYIAGIGITGLPTQLARQKVEAAINETLLKYEKVLRGKDINNFHVFCARALADLSKNKLWLLYFHKFERYDVQSNAWTPRRRQILQTVVRAVESYIKIRDHPSSHIFLWHISRHSQLHPVIHILDELCRTDPFNVDPETFEVCRHAWVTVKDIVEHDRDGQFASGEDNETNPEKKRLFDFIFSLKDEARMRWSTELADAAMLSVSSTDQAQQHFEPVDFSSLANIAGLDYSSLFQDLDGSFNMEIV